MEEFVAAMEDILDVYTQKHEKKRPLVCMDEFPLKNIMAFYTFGGHGRALLSELKYFDKNAADSLAKLIDIKY